MFQIKSQVYRRRDSSADTSKDIDGIEDLELDDDQEEHESSPRPFSDADIDRDSVSDDIKELMTDCCRTSPDLAYCSMEATAV